MLIMLTIIEIYYIEHTLNAGKLVKKLLTILLTMTLSRRKKTPVFRTEVLFFGETVITLVAGKTAFTRLKR